MNLKDARKVARIFNDCHSLKQDNKTHKKSASEATGALQRNLEGINDMANESSVNLGRKYVISCVDQFKKEQGAFVYGKGEGKGHFL